MVKNMFFLDSKHVGMGKCSPPQKSCLFKLDAWFLKIILLGHDFSVVAIRYMAKVYIQNVT